ncbi:MAG: extracellular solute-binding protein [Pseudomonadota bacterium]|nr:extracellular solute-binding protein [Pseudomonadota bacterium]
MGRPDREAVLAEGARKEGEVSVYTSLTADEVGGLTAAFEQRYGVKVKAWRSGSENILRRVVTEARARRQDVDIVETNGPELESLVRENLLLPLRSTHQRDLLPQALQPHGRWLGSRINLFVQAWNTRLLTRDELPRSYADLTNPKWKGKLGIEAEDTDWFMTVVKDLGEERGLRIFREIAQVNGFSVRKGHTLLAGLVSSGEIPFALTVYGHGVEKLKEKGAPIDWTTIEPAIGRANGVGIARGSPHPHAAALFVDFLLSPEGQAILAKGGYVPANTRLPHRAHQQALKFVDPRAMLDEGDKWQALYQQIIVKAAR